MANLHPYLPLQVCVYILSADCLRYMSIVCVYIFLAPEVLHHFPSPFQQARNFHPVNSRLMHGNAVSDARLYNRSLMGGPDAPYMPQGVPPVPPMRGMASYNGARTGSFASFGHPASHFGAPIQVNKKF